MKKIFSAITVFALTLVFSTSALAGGHRGHHGSYQQPHHTAKSAYCYNGDGHRGGNHTQHFKGDGHWYCFF